MHWIDYHILAKVEALLQIRELVSYILTQELNITSTGFIAKCDWQISSAQLDAMRLTTVPEDFPLYLKVVELC